MEDLQRLQLAAQKTRQKILELLSKLDNGDLANADSIAKELKIKYKACVFHLKTLERAGLIEGKFALKENVATKVYHLTQKGKQIYPRVSGLK